MKLVKKYFRDPKDFESTLWLSQITQAYGIEYGAEGWRREMPKIDGLRLLAIQRYLALLVMVVGRLFRPLEGAALHGPAILRAVAGFRGGRRHGREGRRVRHQRPSEPTAAAACLDRYRRRGENACLRLVQCKHSRQGVPVAQSVSLHELLQSHKANDLLVWLRLDVDGRTESENLVTLAYPRELDLLDPGIQPRYPSTAAATRSPCMPRIRLCGRGWNSTARMLAFPITSFT